MLGFMCCCSQVFKATGGKVDYKVGTMIEVPRGALIAGQLAKTAEFFSFGTNDLTQMTFGISRDDAQVGLVQSKLWYIASSSSSVFGWGSWWVRRVIYGACGSSSSNWWSAARTDYAVSLHSCSWLVLW